MGQVRFETKPNTNSLDVITILKDYIDGRNDARYSQLLGLKKDPNVNDAFLMLILQQVNKSISVLIPKVEQFVDALLGVSWMDRPDPVIEEYLSFVQTLISAHSYYCKSAIWMLVSNLSLKPDTDTSAIKIHEVLRTTLNLIPLSRGIIMDALSECIPFFKREKVVQINYISNLIKVSEYCASSESHILKIIFGRLVKLDSSVPREDLLKSVTNPAEDGGMKISQFSETLDGLMEVMFKLCETKCSSKWETQRAFFFSMYNEFESVVLPACGTHHTHYLMLYICSTKPILYQTFIERLWNIFEKPSSPIWYRKSAADYLASFLGKANFVNMETVVFCLEKVSKWIHLYIERQVKGEGAAFFKNRAHMAFYAACHVIFYVVAARHDDFLDNRKLCNSLQSFDLKTIVNCTLNPLRYCHPTTVRQFAESASHLQIVYCHTIIVHNQRLCMPENSVDSSIMDTEYPFEKYLLPGSLHYISPLIIDKPIGREDSFYDSDQVMEEMLAESPRTTGGFMQYFLGSSPFQI